MQDMYEHVTNDQIVIAIDDLFKVLGAKEEMPGVVELLDLLERKETQACVQRMAQWLGLPVRIELSYVSKDFRPGATGGFRSASLSRTDVHGHGIDGITAQVAIPDMMPMFGTHSLEGYPIRVRVSENCRDLPDTFLAVIAHELSHVLLAALWHPQKESELHTDLVPLLLGCRDIARSGRKTVQTTTTQNQTVTHTTTYGYLPDDQFEFACQRVSEILEHLRTRRDDLQGLASAVRALLSETEQRAARFRSQLASLDARPRMTMAGTDAREIVRFHSHDYTRAWDATVAGARSSLTAAEEFLKSLVHYRARTAESMAEHSRALSTMRTRLQATRDALGHDVAILKRTCSPLYRIWHSRLLRRVLPWRG